MGIGAIANVAGARPRLRLEGPRSDANKLNEQLAGINASIAAAQGDLNAVKSSASKASADAQATAGDLDAFKGTVTTNFNTLATTVNAQGEALKGIAAGKHTAAPGAKADKTPAVAGPGEYIVKKGDTLNKISKANGVTLAALEAVNPGVNSKNLKVGQKLKLPEKK